MKLFPPKRFELPRRQDNTLSGVAATFSPVLTAVLSCLPLALRLSFLLTRESLRGITIYVVELR